MIMASTTARSVLVTGASRAIGIGSEVARTFACDGWSVAATYWRPYDEAIGLAKDREEADELIGDLIRLGAPAAIGREADLADPAVPASLVDWAIDAVGPLTALVNVHTMDPGVVCSS